MTKIGAFFASTIGRILIVAVLALAAWLLVAQFLSGRNAKTEARLSRNQAEAALESGRDAVNTVGQAAEREAASSDLTRSNEASIRAAPGAADPVSAEARGAGLAALCKRAAYKDNPRCASH